MGMAALLLATGVLLSRILGFYREMLIAKLHGASIYTDAYGAAFSIPDMLSYFLAAGTLSITFIPLFSSYIAKGDEEGGWRLFSIVGSTMGSILFVSICIAWILAPYLVPLYVPGFENQEQIELTVLMTRIILPAPLLFYFGGLLQATLFVREKFWPAAISPLIYNICIILGGVLLHSSLGIVGFAIGVLVGAFLGPFGLTFLVARKDLKYQFLFNLKDPGFLEFFRISLPVMVGVGLVTLDQWVLNYFGSQQGEGAMSWLINGRKLMMVAFALIGQAAGQAALPFLTRLFHENKTKEIGEMMTLSLKRIVFLAAIAAIGLAVLSKPIVHALFQRGAFTIADADTTAGLLALFSFGLVSWCVQSFAVRGFYARKDTITPMIVSTVIVVIAVPVYYFLQKSFNIQGLAMASSIGISLNAIATIVVYDRLNGGLNLRSIFKSVVSGLLHGFPAGAAAFWIATQFNPSSDFENALQLGSASIGFGIVILVLSMITKAEELDFLISKIRRKLGK